MDDNQVAQFPDLPPPAVQALLAKVKVDIAYVNQEKLRVEELALYYQTKIAALTKEKDPQQSETPVTNEVQGASPRPAKRRRSAQSQTEVVARLQAELDTSNARATSVSQEKRLLEEKIQNRDRSIAEDAKELDRLRQENTQLHDMQIRLRAVQAELKAAEMRTQRHTMESQVRLSLGEENTRFLQAEITRLSEELTKSRFAADVATASHATSIRSENERNKELSKQLATATGRILKMEGYQRELETDNSTVKSALDREQKDYEEERKRLNKIVELQKDLTKEAEQRVSDYEQVVKSLMEEIGAREKEKTQKGRLGTHAEVLLKNLQDALDSRIRLLHQQKQEMERARASETALLAREETLIREAEDARWETEQAKKEMARMTTQVKDQARKIVLLEKQIELQNSQQQQEAVMGIAQSPESPRRSSGFLSSGAMTPNDVANPIGTPNTLQEVDAAVQELASIRKRHHHLMMVMRARRTAYS